MRHIWLSTKVSCLIVILALTLPSPSNAVDADSYIMESGKALEQWMRFENSTKKLTRGLVKMALSSFMRDADRSLNISSPCMQNVMKLIGGLRDIKPWAFSFFDSSGKLIEGMLMGTMANLGEYDQCVNTEAIHERSGKVMFTGKYCALDIKPPLPPKKKYYKLTEVIEELKNFSQRGTVVSEAAKSAHLFYMVSMRLGICVPSGCQESDISQITDRISEEAGFLIKVNRCEIKKEKDYTPLVIAVICICSLFGLLVALGTLIDVVCYYSGRKVKSLPLELLMAFSFVSNFKRLVSVDSEASPLCCFSGLRVLSITWIILGHTYLNINLVLFRGLKSVMEFPNDFAFQAVINATVAVDTFFFMGGTLVSYLAIKVTKDMNKPFNVGLYIFHRIFRIWPVYAMVLIFMFLAPVIGYGPIWEDSAQTFVNSCYRNWWTNLIFINNFYHSDDMCLTQSWYVACDIQLYIVALVVILPLLRSPRVGLTIASILVVASMVGSAVLTYVMGYPPTMLYVHPDHEDRVQFWAESYFKPYSHAGPYFIGMLVGYLLITKPKLQFSLRTRVFGWSFAAACNLAVLYGVWEWNRGRDANMIETLLYSGCHRVAWALGIAWVVINCATGQGGVVNYILTWRCWRVLGRLTYTAYLIHPIVQITAVGILRMKLQPWHYFAVWMYFGHLAITYGCSFATSMLVEAPFLAIEKIIFKRKAKTDQLSNNNVETTKGGSGVRNEGFDPDDGQVTTITKSTNGQLQFENGPVLTRTKNTNKSEEKQSRMKNGYSPNWQRNNDVLVYKL